MLMQLRTIYSSLYITSKIVHSLPLNGDRASRVTPSEFAIRPLRNIWKQIYPQQYGRLRPVSKIYSPMSRRLG